MKAPGGNCPDITTLKPCDHQAFFEALDALASAAEALRAAFRRWNDCPAGLQGIEQADD